MRIDGRWARSDGLKISVYCREHGARFGMTEWLDMNAGEATFRGKTAIVTGAGRGIGEAMARRLARRGAAVVLNDIRDATNVAQEIRRDGGQASFVQGDVSNLQDMQGLVQEAVSVFGGVDLLVANAAMHLRGLFWEQPIEDARRTVDVTMWGPYNAVRAAASQMILQGKGGAIVVIGSPHTHVPAPLCMAYNMAKGATTQMARTAAAELLAHRIRVNIVEPGWTNTPGERNFFTEEQIASQSKLLPAGRIGLPDEVARVACFLLEEESDYINGATYVVDGGLQLPQGNIV